MDEEEIAAALVDDEFRKAAGVLKMISQSPEDREFYESRMKALHDVEANLIATAAKNREAGREEGREEGVLAGKILLLQQLLGDKESDTETLVQLGVSELSKLLTELQERLRSRG